MNENFNKLTEKLSFIENDVFRQRLKRYVKKILEIPLEIEGILLFGSLARGDAIINQDYMSDIDLIILSKDLPEDLWERHEKIHDLTFEFNAYIQALWWTPKEMIKNVEDKYYLILDALDEGKILYDPNNLLQELKTKLKKELKKKGVIKKELYWYWPMKKFGEEIEF
ncbi:MAG: nucleotidyltransferase domain-containing protein [Promethearchaeota archaeon]|nr:MAG: nucleotidyltransferase domain-containing protein [Candidatus Lokiarchaeota archaeon]